jgi:hypothetical protein
MHRARASFNARQFVVAGCLVAALATAGVAGTPKPRPAPATTPQSTRAWLGGRAPSIPPDLSPVARAAGVAQGFIYIEDHPGIWYVIMLDHGDTTTVWPTGQRVGLTLAQAADTSHRVDRVVLCDELFAMTPPPQMRMLRLGVGAVKLDPGELWRKSIRRKGGDVVCTSLRARFAPWPDSLEVVGLVVAGPKPPGRR